MPHTPFELSEEFPEYAPLIQKMNKGDAHFQRLTEAYHTLNRYVHRAESDIEPTSHQYLEEMKVRRSHLKDEILQMLKTGSEKPETDAPSSENPSIHSDF